MQACRDARSVRLPGAARRWWVGRRLLLARYWLGRGDLDEAARHGIFALRLARDGIRLRQFGQQVIESLGGKRIHPAWVVPGGVNAPLAAAQRDAILAALPEVMAVAELSLSLFKQ